MHGCCYVNRRFVGKIRKDKGGRKASIFDHGNNPADKGSGMGDRKNSKWIEGRGCRRELLCVLQSSRNNRDARRRLITLGASDLTTGLLLPTSTTTGAFPYNP